MKLNKIVCLVLVSLLAVFGLAGCANKEQPDFSGYKQIAELATVEYTFHNVAEIYNDGTNILFGLKINYKKAWFEYDGKVKVGIDVSQVKIEGPDANNVVTISIPKAQIIGTPDADESSFSDVYKDTTFLTDIDSVDQSQALQVAQEEMKKAVENNPELMMQARKRAEDILSQYVKSVGEARGQNYETKFIEIE